MKIINKWYTRWALKALGINKIFIPPYIFITDKITMLEVQYYIALDYFIKEKGVFQYWLYKDFFRAEAMAKKDLYVQSAQEVQAQYEISKKTK